MHLLDDAALGYWIPWTCRPWKMCTDPGLHRGTCKDKLFLYMNHSMQFFVYTIEITIKRRGRGWCNKAPLHTLVVLFLGNFVQTLSYNFLNKWSTEEQGMVYRISFELLEQGSFNWSRIHQHTISSRFMGIILRVLQTWGFSMVFLNQRKGAVVFYQFFLLSHWQCTVTKCRNCKRLREFEE